MILFHGSPFLFDHFDLRGAGSGTGVKFGYGVYLTEAEASAVHYSQPRKLELMPEHYLYKVEIPDLIQGNHLVSALPVDKSIITKVEAELGTTVPPKNVLAGKKFRKWIGTLLTGVKKAGYEEEKAAADFLDRLGVYYNVWPTAQTKPDGPKNIAVFNASRTKIIGIERISIERQGDKWVLTERTKL